MLIKLHSDSKPKFLEITKELNVSRKTILKYLNNLRKNEIINNFTININPNIQPNIKFVIMEIKTNPKEPQLIADLLKIHQLKMLDGILGEFSLLALFIFRDSSEFTSILPKIDNIMASSYFKKYQILETIKVFKTNGMDLTNSNIGENKEIDGIDNTILSILQNDQGSKLISTYEIASMMKKQYNLDVSQSTIYNRIKILERTGVILNYALNFDAKKIGFKGKYIVRIKPKDPSKYDILALNLVKKKEITDLFRIGEQYGLLAIVRVKEIENYGTFIKGLYESEEIEDTFTNYVLDERISYSNFAIFS